MASHIHYLTPGATITCSAASDILGGRLVEIVADRAVLQATAGSSKVLGTAAQDASDGDAVLVLRGGVQLLQAAEPISAGDRVAPAEGGTIAPAAAGEASIGLALTTATAAGLLAQIVLD